MLQKSRGMVTLRLIAKEWINQWGNCYSLYKRGEKSCKRVKEMKENEGFKEHRSWWGQRTVTVEVRYLCLRWKSRANWTGLLLMLKIKLHGPFSHLTHQRQNSGLPGARHQVKIMTDMKQMQWALCLPSLVTGATFHASKQGGKLQAKSSRVSDLRRCSWDSVETKSTRIGRTKNRRESRRENSICT